MTSLSQHIHLAETAKIEPAPKPVDVTQILEGDSRARILLKDVADKIKAQDKLDDPDTFKELNSVGGLFAVGFVVDGPRLAEIIAGNVCPNAYAVYSKRQHLKDTAKLISAMERLDAKLSDRIEFSGMFLGLSSDEATGDPHSMEEAEMVACVSHTREAKGDRKRVRDLHRHLSLRLDSPAKRAEAAVNHA